MCEYADVQIHAYWRGIRRLVSIGASSFMALAALKPSNPSAYDRYILYLYKVMIFLKGAELVAFSSAPMAGSMTFSSIN